MDNFKHNNKLLSFQEKIPEQVNVDCQAKEPKFGVKTQKFQLFSYFFPPSLELIKIMYKNKMEIYMNYVESAWS